MCLKKSEHNVPWLPDEDTLWYAIGAVIQGPSKGPSVRDTLNITNANKLSVCIAGAIVQQSVAALCNPQWSILRV